VLLNIVRVDDAEIVKSRGPRTDPWGTPEVHGADADECKDEWVDGEAITTNEYVLGNSLTKLSSSFITPHGQHTATVIYKHTVKS